MNFKMAYMQTEVLSHAQKICRLYKAAARMTQAWYPERCEFRYHVTVLRARFDETKDVKDMVKAKKMMEAAKLELWTKQHPQPLKFANSPGGGAYGREVHLPDWVLDTWHPLEKKAYPDYFKRREQRKQEFIERWEKKYGKSGIEVSP